jgi:hypothetical protein
MRGQIWEIRDERQRAWRRRQIWEIEMRGRFERWEAERGGGWESENGEISLGLENMLFILPFFFQEIA